MKRIYLRGLSDVLSGKELKNVMGAVQPTSVMKSMARKYVKNKMSVAVVNCVSLLVGRISAVFSFLILEALVMKNFITNALFCSFST